MNKLGCMVYITLYLVYIIRFIKFVSIALELINYSTAFNFKNIYHK